MWHDSEDEEGSKTTVFKNTDWQFKQASYRSCIDNTEAAP